MQVFRNRERQEIGDEHVRMYVWNFYCLRRDTLVYHYLANDESVSKALEMEMERLAEVLKIKERDAKEDDEYFDEYRDICKTSSERTKKYDSIELLQQYGSVGYTRQYTYKLEHMSVEELVDAANDVIGFIRDSLIDFRRDTERKIDHIEAGIDDLDRYSDLDGFATTLVYERSVLPVVDRKYVVDTYLEVIEEILASRELFPINAPRNFVSEEAYDRAFEYANGLLEDELSQMKIDFSRLTRSAKRAR